MRNETIDAISALAQENKDIILLTGDLGFSVLEKFRDSNPDQFINVGVSEQAMIGIAAGLALSGRRVIVYSIVNFTTLRCLEQLRNDVCYHNLPVMVVAVGGGLAYGTQGYTHHGIEDLGIMAMLPNMTVTCPADTTEALALVPNLLQLNGPSYLRLGRAGEKKIHAEVSISELGRPIKLRHGHDIALLATGPVLSRAIDAADALAVDGISASVYSFPVITPLHDDAIDEIATTHRGILTLEEHSVHGGFGSIIADRLMQGRHRVAFQKWGITDAVRMKLGSQSALLDQLPSIPELARGLL